MKATRRCFKPSVMAIGTLWLAARSILIFFQHAKTIFVDDFDIPAGWRTFASYDHGSSRPYAWLAWAESDGTDVTFKNGRTMSTLPGDLFQVGEVYGNRNGEPDKGTGESIAEITMRIQSYKIARGWRYPDSAESASVVRYVSSEFADSAIDQDMNEFSVAEEFKHGFGSMVSSIPELHLSL